MGKITLLARTLFLSIFVLGSSLTFLTANTKAPAEINISGTVEDVLCHDGTNGSINTTISGGVEPYTITWTGTSQDSEDISGLSAGSYTITVVDSEGSEASQEFTITEPAPLQAAAPSATDVSCNGASDGSITAGSTTGGTAPFQYSRDTVNFQDSPEFTGLPEGTYTIYIKDAQGCETSQEISVNQPDVLAIAAPSSTPISCNGGSDGTVTAGTVTGGNGSYQYKINNGSYSSSNTFSGLAANTYTITVRDAEGCETSQEVTVSEPEVLVMTSPSSTPVSCNGGSDGTVTAGTVTGGNGSYEYKINNGSYGSSNSFTGLAANTYTLTVRDAEGCETSQEVTVSQPDVLVMTTPSSTPVSCNGASDGTATAGTVTGGNGSYEYKINNGSYSSSNVFPGLTANTYTITVRDAEGCETSQEVTITQPDALAMAAPSSTPVSCNGGSDGTVTAGTVTGGNGSYEYKINNGSYGSSNSFSGLTAQVYTITVRDAEGCETSQEVTVSEPELLVIGAPTLTPVSCNTGSDGTATAGTVTGGNGPYLYKLGNGSYGNSTSFSNLAAGTYTITVKDAQNCQSSVDFIITEPDELSMTDPTSTPVSCFAGEDGTVTAGEVSGGNGDYQYSVDNTTFTEIKTFSGLPAGTHTIFVKDSKGCSLQKTVTITEPQVLSATVSRTNVSCYEGNDGIINISSPSGGSNSYEFSINGTEWQSSSSFTGLTTGSYNVQIRDKNAPSCIITLKSNYEITQPSVPLTAEVSTTRTTLYGTSTGTATATPSGGTPGYTYEWRKSGENTVLQVTQKATNLLAGIYEVTVTDTKGCKIIVEVEIIDAVDALILSRSTCEIEDDIDAIRTFHFIVEDETARGGVGPYTYEWDFGPDAIDRNRSGIGEFWVDYTSTGNKTITLTVTDSQGETFITTQDQFIGKCYNPCGRSSNIEFDPDNMYLGYDNGDRIDPLSIDYCDPSVPKFIFIQVDKSANIYNPYIELGFNISNDITGEVNQYYVSGCRSGDDIDEDQTVNQPFRVGGYIKLTLEALDLECGDNLNIDTFYTTWTNVSKKECGQNNNKFCYSTNAPVHVATELRAEATPTHILCKEESTGTITVKASGGFAPYSYRLSLDDVSQTTTQFYNLAAGEYTIYVEDAAGKTTTTTATVIEPETKVTASIDSQNIICYGGTGEATVTATGGTPFSSGEPYTYLWNDAAGQTSSTATGLAAGEYTVTVTDANDCQTLQVVTIVEPEQLTVAQAGEDQEFSCGFNTTSLEGNTPETGTGTWEIVSGEGGTIEDITNPSSTFSGTAGTYTLRWSISHPDGTCGTSDEVTISFIEDCSTLDFDGLDDYITMEDNYGLTSGTFSLEAWVKLEATSGVRTVISKRNSKNLSEGGYDLVINNGAPTFRWGNSSVSTSSKLGTQRWYHLGVIFKDSRAYLYVDGIRVGNVSATNPSSISSPFLIGAMNDADSPEVPQNYFHGWIEEVRIWRTALTEEQLRFMMNQRIQAAGTSVKGTVLPMNVPGDLVWEDLSGYYQLLVTAVANGYTPDLASSAVDGALKNIETMQENTAPLPYISATDGTWRDRNIWQEPIVWDVPNGVGINGENINWNIVQISHNISSGGKNINLLGLLSETGTLTMMNPNETADENNSGQGLRITHYLNLDGNIDLVGESQLVQTDVMNAADITDPTVEFVQTITSVLDEASSGYLERDQQGTANSYNYNYWSSPVSLQGAANNSTYTIASVMLDGTTSSTPKGLSFHGWHEYADGGYSNPRKISAYWLHKFRGTANVYSEWVHIGSTGVLNAGEGYTMKGTSGTAKIEDRQNYVYKGKPNNGTITLNIGKDQNYLLGNPYPSAMDVNEFILDNLSSANGGRNSANIFNGAVYFWDHFAGGNTHILKEYIGGYATRNLLDGVPAISSDERITANNALGTKIPGRYIPVAQGFFINTSLDPNNGGDLTVAGGDVLFKNNQRAFVRESSGNSVFLRPEQNSKQAEKKDTRPKIRLDFKSPLKYVRQILVGVDSNTTNGFDLGYDAALNDYNVEDMFWLIKGGKFVIQGVPDFDLDQTLPLGILIKEEGEFTIRINALENISDDTDIYLKDKVENQYFDLRKSEFTSSLEAGNYMDRYEIVFDYPQDPVKVEPGEEVEEENELPGGGGTDGNGSEEGETKGEVEVYYLHNSQDLVILNPDLLKVENVSIFSIKGQELEDFGSIPVQKEVKLPVRSYHSAVYIVKLITNKGLVQKKIIINN